MALTDKARDRPVLPSILGVAAQPGVSVGPRPDFVPSPESRPGYQGPSGPRTETRSDSRPDSRSGTHGSSGPSLSGQRQDPPEPLQPSVATYLAVTKEKPSESGSAKELVEVMGQVKNGKAQVRTAQGETLTCDLIPTYRPPKVGESIRAEVTRQGGKATQARFKAWR